MAWMRGVIVGLIAGAALALAGTAQATDVGPRRALLSKPNWNLVGWVSG